MFSLKNIPNFLTILRIVLIPSIIVCIELDNQQYYWIALFLYVTACFSDFFDGYLARKFDIESNFGRFLDPIADKILVVSILIILIAIIFIGIESENKLRYSNLTSLLNTKNTSDLLDIQAIHWRKNLRSILIEYKNSKKI